MKCKNCGAEIGNSKFCEYCGSQITVEMQKEQEQLNKSGCPKCGSSNIRFEREKQGETKGNKGTQIIHVTTGICNDCGYTWQTQDSLPKRKTWLWVLGWIFIFPLPLTIILIRKKDMNKIIKYGLIALAWIVYLVIAICAGAGNSDDNANTKIEKNIESTIVSSSQAESKWSDVTSNSQTESKSSINANDTGTEGFVDYFNDKSETKLILKEQFVPKDKANGHYRTEFRLSAYDNATGNSYDYNGKTVDVIERKDYLDEKSVIRLYADDISLEDSCAIIESAAGFFDKELSQDDISEITTYLKEHKIANGYYKGNVSILYTGNSLMIKSSND